MKRILLSALAVGTLVATFQLFSGSKAAPPQQTYPLVCRGGGSLVTGLAPGERNIGFTFVRGTKPAGEGLAPGECSWTDRGMYSSEPDESHSTLKKVPVLWRPEESSHQKIVGLRNFILRIVTGPSWSRITGEDS